MWLIPYLMFILLVIFYMYTRKCSHKWLHSAFQGHSTTRKCAKCNLIQTPRDNTEFFEEVVQQMERDEERDRISRSKRY